MLALSVPVLRRALAGVALAAASAPLAAQATASRESAWREDLDSARIAFPRRDHSFSPAARGAYERRLTRLADSVPALDDDQIVVRLAAAVATAGNAHTRLYLLRNRTALRRYPVRVWWFGRDLYVVRAHAADSALLGARVTAIAGRPVAALARLVRPLYAGNAQWARYIGTYTLTSPDVLHGLGVVDTSGAVTVDAVARDGRRVRRVLQPMPLERTDEPTEAWWDLAPTHPGRGGPWVSALAVDSTRLPLYLRRPLDNYWYEYLPEQRAMYVSYARSQDQPGGEATAAFAARLLDEIATRSPDRVVVDLRFNTGGNLDLAEEPFRALARLPVAQRRGGLVVITGRATFSAGLYLAALLKQLAPVAIVGEPVGDALDFWAEGGNMTLPHSRLTMHFADRFHSYSPVRHDDRMPFVRNLAVRSMAPDVTVEPTFAQWAAGRDPVLDAALAWRPR